MAQKITKEIIEKVKAENAGAQLYSGGVSFTDAEGERRDLEFIYRRPTVADMEAFNKMASKSAFTAQANLLNGLIIYPEAGEITAALAEYPPVVANFVDEYIVPFFGTAIASRSSRI